MTADNQWTIEHPCPQCGAPVVLEETDRLLVCGFCKVRLYLQSGDFFRYYLPPAENISEKIIYVPYWRMKGMMFSCEGIDIVQRAIDTTSIASDKTSLPLSLGFRPQVLKLKIVSPDMPVSFVSADTTHVSLSAVLKKQISALGQYASPSPSFHQAFIGETVSLIYAPVYIKDSMLYDAVLDRPVSDTGKQAKADMLTLESPGGELAFISTLCPNCGWDLSGEKDSCVMLCRNCESAWQPDPSGFKRLDFGTIDNSEKSSVYLPFWGMKAKVDGLKLESYADLVRLANLPKAILNVWETTGLFFWTPAFKIQPPLFLRLSRQMTISRPEGPFIEKLPQARLYPVTLPSAEAAESLKVILAHIGINKKKLFPMLSDIDIRLDKCRLVYFPFREDSNELVHPDMGFGILKSALDMGRNI